MLEQTGVVRTRPHVSVFKEALGEYVGTEN